MPEISTSIPILVLCGALAYAVGSLPIGRFLAQIIRSRFSREHPKGAAFTKVFSDQLKGFLVVYTACTAVGGDAAQLTAVLVYLGHAHPIAGKWRGGRGVGTLLGALTGLDALLGLIALCAWLFTFFVFRYATFAMMMSTLVTPLTAFSMGFHEVLGLLFLLAALQLSHHRAAIMELFEEGSEPIVDWDPDDAHKPSIPRISKSGA